MIKFKLLKKRGETLSLREQREELRKKEVGEIIHFLKGCGRDDLSKLLPAVEVLSERQPTEASTSLLIEMAEKKENPSIVRVKAIEGLAKMKDPRVGEILKSLRGGGFDVGNAAEIALQYWEGTSR